MSEQKQRTREECFECLMELSGRSTVSEELLLENIALCRMIKAGDDEETLLAYINENW